MKCPKCGKKLTIKTDKKYGGTFAVHTYPLALILGHTDYSTLCKYNKRIK